jgi:MurNAc alpha-1-phosphate uridylyltransferase
MVDNPPQHPLGDFSISATRDFSKTTVDSSQSKTSDALQAPLLLAEGSEKLTFSGIGIYQPQLFAHIAQGLAAKLAPILREAMHNRQVTGEHFKGQWFDIGTPERLQLLDAMLNQ